MAYSANREPGELTALTTLATDDVFIVGDTSDASEVAKHITKANLITDLSTSFAAALGADDNYVTDAEKTKLSNLSGTNTGDQDLSGYVTKVGTPADNQVGVWTGDGTLEGDAGLTFNATTKTLSINSSTDNNPLIIERTNNALGGPFIKTKHTTASPAAGDYIGGVDLYSFNSAASEQAYAYFNAKIISPTADAEYGSFVIETIRNGTLGGAGKQMLEVGAESDAAINGISVGFDDAAGIVSSRGNQDLVLQTGNATTGNITIVDGADGQIQLNPNGSGAVKIGTLTGVLRADTGVVSVDTDVTDIVSAASDTAAGKVELATAAETTTGTDTARAVTPAGAAATYLPILFDATPNTDHTATGKQTSTLNAGATIAIGECVYLGSGGKWLKADNDATATTDKLLAIALEAKNDTEAMRVALPGTFVRDDSWNWTVGAAIYLSDTAGALTETKPTKATDRVVRVVGYAVSADVMWFMPETGVTYA